MAPFDDRVSLEMRAGAKHFDANPAAASSYVETLTKRYPKPAVVFCSRELEEGLREYVRNQVSNTGLIPSDESLRAQARLILGETNTAADDPVLLEKFKKLVEETLSNSRAKSLSPAAPPLFHPRPSTVAPTLTEDLDLTMSDEQLDDILQDMNFEFDPVDFLGTEENSLDISGGSIPTALMDDDYRHSQ
jgi:hypothetical protein